MKNVCKCILLLVLLLGASSEVLAQARGIAQSRLQTQIDRAAFVCSGSDCSVELADIKRFAELNNLNVDEALRAVVAGVAQNEYAKPGQLALTAQLAADIADSPVTREALTKMAEAASPPGSRPVADLARQSASDRLQAREDALAAMIRSELARQIASAPAACASGPCERQINAIARLAASPAARTDVNTVLQQVVAAIARVPGVSNERLAAAARAAAAEATDQTTRESLIEVADAAVGPNADVRTAAQTTGADDPEAGDGFGFGNGDGGSDDINTLSNTPPDLDPVSASPS